MSVLCALHFVALKCWTEHQLLCTSNPLAEAEICCLIFLYLCSFLHFKTNQIESVYLHYQMFQHFVQTLMRSLQTYKHYIYASCCPGQVGRWNLIVACGMLKPVYFAFVKTMLEFLQTTHFVKSRAHLPGPTRKIIAMIALRHAILMRADPVVKVHVHCLFSGRGRSCKKRPLFKQSKKNLNKADSLRLYWVWCSLLKKYSVIKHTRENNTQ